MDILAHLSVEQIRNEFCKIACSKDFHIILQQNLDIFSYLIPELKDMIGFPQNNPYHAYDVLEHTIHAIEHCESNDLVVRLAVFFHDFGKPHSFQDGEDGIRHFKGHGRVSADLSNSIMKRLHFDDQTRTQVAELVSYHDAAFDARKKYVKRWLNKIGSEQFTRLLEVRKADIKGQQPTCQNERIQKINDIEELLNEVLQEETSISLRNLAINGKDLISIGYQPGKELGTVLNILLQMVIEQKIPNKKEDLLDAAKKRGNWYNYFSHS